MIIILAADANNTDVSPENIHTIQLRVRVLDHKKRKPQHKENEAIQFDYSILNDIPEDVAAEMVCRGDCD